MDEPRVIARGDDASKIARGEDLTGIGIELARGADGIEVADRVRQIYHIEQVKELCRKLNIVRFRQGKALCNCKIEIPLPWSTQTIASNVRIVMGNLISQIDHDFDVGFLTRP